MSRQVQTLAPSGLARYTVYSESRMDCWECGESRSPFQSTVTCRLSQAQVGDRLSSWNLPQEPRDGGILTLPLDHPLSACSLLSKARSARRVLQPTTPTGVQDSQKALSSSAAGILQSGGFFDPFFVAKCRLSKSNLSSWKHRTHEVALHELKSPELCHPKLQFSQ